MNIENRQLLEELSHSMHGRALKEFLKEKYETIGDITQCTSWEHTVGRQYALGVLKEIFSFLEEKQVSEKGPRKYT